MSGREVALSRGSSVGYADGSCFRAIYASRLCCFGRRSQTVGDGYYDGAVLTNKGCDVRMIGRRSHGSA